MLTDAQIEAFLDEALPADQMTAIEESLREDDSLGDRVAEAVGRRDAGLHSLGAIWRRRRLSCPNREQLGSYLLGVSDKALADYIKFHLEVVGCRMCTASIADLEAKHTTDAEAVGRQRRYFQSSAGYLRDSD